jgi:hypothetical protein
MEAGEPGNLGTGRFEVGSSRLEGFVKSEVK